MIENYQKMASSATDVPYNHATENVLFGQNVIEKISDTCLGQDGKRYYQVKWRDSWEPEERLMAACESALQAFWKEYYANVEKEIRKQVVNASKAIPDNINDNAVTSITTNVPNVQPLVTNATTGGSAVVDNFPEQSSTVAYYAVQDNDAFEGKDQGTQEQVTSTQANVPQQIVQSAEELEKQHQLQQDLHGLQQVDIITTNLSNPDMVQHEISSADLQQSEMNAQAEILTQIINSQNGVTANKWIEDKINRRTLTTITADTLNTKVVSGPDANSKFHCDICLKPFVSKRNVQRHMLTHTGEKPWMCEYCFKRFRQKPHLEQHVNIHKGIKNSICEVCGKAFNHRSNLVTHMATHSDNRPFICAVCGENFKLKHTLAKHMMVHTKQDIDKRHQCQVCKRSFRDKSYLAEHETIHQKEKPWKCDVCGKTFSFKRRYQMHLELHQSKDGGSEYICHLCPKEFKSKGYLQKHLERHESKRRRRKKHKEKKEGDEVNNTDVTHDNDETESIEGDDNGDLKIDELEEGETTPQEKAKKQHQQQQQQQQQQQHKIIVEGNSENDELVVASMLPMNSLNMEEATYVALAQLTQAAAESAPMDESGNVILMSYEDIQRSMQEIQDGQAHDNLQSMHGLQQEHQNAITTAIQHQGELQIITQTDDQQNNTSIMHLQIQGSDQQPITVQMVADVPDETRTAMHIIPDISTEQRNASNTKMQIDNEQGILVEKQVTDLQLLHQETPLGQINEQKTVKDDSHSSTLSNNIEVDVDQRMDTSMNLNQEK